VRSGKTLKAHFQNIWTLVADDPLGQINGLGTGLPIRVHLPVSHSFVIGPFLLIKEVIRRSTHHSKGNSTLLKKFKKGKEERRKDIGAT